VIVAIGLVLTVLATTLVPVPRPALGRMEPVVAKQLADIRAKLDKAIARGNATGPLFGETGRVYHAYLIVDAAEACYRNAEILEPTEFQWPYLLGVLQQDDNRLDDAAASLERALARPEQYYPAWVRLATVELARGRIDAAATALARVREHAPNDPARLLVEGQVALAQRDYDRALDALTRAVRLQPRANRLHYLIGMTYRAMGNSDAARDELKQSGAVGVRPLDPLIDGVRSLRRGASAYMVDGFAALRAGDNEGAADAFRRAVEIGGSVTVTALVNLAAAESRLGHNGEAIASLNRARQLEPDNVPALYNLGLLLDRESRHAEAEGLFRRAMELSPNDDQVRTALGRTLLARDKPADGLAMLEAIRAIDPADCASTLEALAGVQRSPDAATHERAAALDRRLRAGVCSR